MCGAFSSFCFFFVPSLPLPLLSTVYQCDGCLSYLGRGGSWLGCQVWPAINGAGSRSCMCGAFSSFFFFFVPSLPLPLLSTVYQCDGCLSYLGRGGSWLGCQVWPAISAVSILELVANSGSSRMSRAPNLHSLRATKLFNILKYTG